MRDALVFKWRREQKSFVDSFSTNILFKKKDPWRYYICKYPQKDRLNWVTLFCSFSLSSDTFPFIGFGVFYILSNWPHSLFVEDCGICIVDEYQIASNFRYNHSYLHVVVKLSRGGLTKCSEVQSGWLCELMKIEMTWQEIDAAAAGQKLNCWWILYKKK